MSKRQFTIVFLAAIIGGIIGGAFSSRFFTKEANATNSVNHPIITASEFRVVDEKGEIISTLGQNGFIIDGKEYSVSLCEWGLRIDWNTQGHDKFEKAITMICPLGFRYREFSKREISERGIFFSKIGPPGLDGFDNLAMGWTGEGPAITLRDSKLNDRIVLGPEELIQSKSGSRIIRPPSSIVMFDEKGKVVWEAP